jgi:hypothetical protein
MQPFKQQKAMRAEGDRIDSIVTHSNYLLKNIEYKNCPLSDGGQKAWQPLLL